MRCNCSELDFLILDSLKDHFLINQLILLTIFTSLLDHFNGLKLRKPYRLHSQLPENFIQYGLIVDDFQGGDGRKSIFGNLLF